MAAETVSETATVELKLLVVEGVELALIVTVMGMDDETVVERDAD